VSGRLTRWLGRIAVGVGALGAIALLSGASYEQLMRRRTRHDFPAPGRLVDVGGGRRMQIDCRGAGSPTVVLESGLDNFGSLSWVAVHDSIATTTRVCAYSRAGIMWSEASNAPFDLASLARDLHAALDGAGERAPYVMAGHSIGGPYAMAFTAAYPSEVKGLVLVDASHPDQIARYRQIAGKSLAPPPGQVKLGAALAWTGLVRLLAPGGTPASWPVEMDRVAKPLLPLSIGALAKETEAVPVTLQTARSMRDLGDRPVVVLTAGEGQSTDALESMGLTREQGVRLHEAWRSMHDDEATWSRRARHEIVPNASHYIQFDQPAVVIRATREVVEAVRAAGATR
jgi:pimeloyl-ACP methyl ester carboxylesterase